MKQRTMSVLICAVTLSACGGGGGDSGGSGPSSPPSSRSPGGLWTTQYVEPSGPNAGDTMQGTALVTEAGDLFFAQYNTVNGCAVVGLGRIGVNGSAVSGSTRDGIVSFTTAAGVTAGCTFPDGTVSATSALSGTLVPRSQLKLTASSVSASGTALGTEAFTWSYSNLYGVTPSLAQVAGTYTAGAGSVLTVSTNGSIFEQDAASGCVINGEISIINPAYNAYSVSLGFSGCVSSTVLNGLNLSGLGYYDNSVNPGTLVYGVSGTVNGQTIALAGWLRRT